MATTATSTVTADTQAPSRKQIQPEINPLFQLSESGLNAHIHKVTSNNIVIKPAAEKGTGEKGFFTSLLKFTSNGTCQEEEVTIKENGKGFVDGDDNVTGWSSIPPLSMSDSTSFTTETETEDYHSVSDSLINGYAHSKELPTLSTSTLHNASHLPNDDPLSSPSTATPTRDLNPRGNMPNVSIPNSRMVPPASPTSPKTYSIDGMVPLASFPSASAPTPTGNGFASSGFLSPPLTQSTSKSGEPLAPSTSRNSEKGAFPIIKRSATVGDYSPLSPPIPSTSRTLPTPQFPSSPSQTVKRPKRHVRTQSFQDHHLSHSDSEDVPENRVEADFEEILKAQMIELKRQRQNRKDLEQKRERSQSRGERPVTPTSAELMGKVLVGNLIGEDHVNYVLMYNMLTGIRIGVSRCQAKVRRALTDEDFTAKHKYSFDIVGNELTPSAKYDFKFKDYAPWVFRDLREHFLLDPADYLLSLTAKYILSELGSPGKSGSFFYFSRDYRFIIKTIHHSEHKFLRKILKDYHTHIKSNPHTLLSRFYGLHRVKLPRGRKIHFLIMNNLFPPHRDVHETYDLKGSAVGRVYDEEKAKTNPNCVLKDLNWERRKRQLDLGPEKRAFFEEQTKRDVELLQRLKIMDYSLLIGIHSIVRGSKEGLREKGLTMFQPEATQKLKRRPTQIKAEREAEAFALRRAVQRSDPKEVVKLPGKDRSERKYFIFYQDEGGFRGTDDNNDPLDTIYYLGIIDILTPYNWFKGFETFFKGFKYDRSMISAVPPKQYGDRFMRFLFSSIRGADTSNRPKME